MGIQQPVIRFEDGRFCGLCECSHGRSVQQRILGKDASGDQCILKSSEQAQAFLKIALGDEIQKEVLNGFPVTEKAIRDIYEKQRVVYKDNDYVSGQGGTYNLDEEEIIMLIRVPDEPEINALIAWIQSLDTAYVEDKTFENVVYEEGERYIRGDKSLEEVLGSIETRVGIYLAE